MELGPDNLAMREFIYSLIDPIGVKSVLDIGCGWGHDLFQLGQRLPNATKLVGLDISEKTIEAAKGAAPADGRYELVAHDASNGLPFEDGQIDLLYSLNFLECVLDRQTLLKEMHRVLSPGGQIVCAHFDWDTQSFDGIDKSLVRRIVHAYSDWQQDWMAAADGWMGRRLWGEFQRTGLFDGRIETYLLTNTKYTEPFYGYMKAQAFGGLARRELITRKELEVFSQGLDEQQKRGEYFYSINMYIYTGRKA